MSDRDALLAAVLANPDDDLPRLVMADWLDEHGEHGRAELIRVQCELAVIRLQQDEFSQADISHFDYTRAVADRRQDVIRARERVLLRGTEPSAPQPRVDWLGDEIVGWPWDVGGWTWVCGFPESWRCPLRLWTSHGPAVVAAHPVRVVRLTDREPADRTEINGQWYWFEDGRNALGDWADGSHIPRELFDLLPNANEDTIGLPYPTAADAHAALSDALIAWAKAWPGRAAAT